MEYGVYCHTRINLNRFFHVTLWARQLDPHSVPPVVPAVKLDTLNNSDTHVQTKNIFFWNTMGKPPSFSSLMFLFLAAAVAALLFTASSSADRQGALGWCDSQGEAGCAVELCCGAWAQARGAAFVQDFCQGNCG